MTSSAEFNRRTALTGFANGGNGRQNELWIKGSKLNATASQIDNAIAQLPSTTKTVTIASESDLPTAVGGRHPLEDDTDYLIVDDLDTGTDGFLLGNNTIVRAADSSIVTLTYTGTDPMFKSVADSNKITMIRLDSPNAELFEMSGTTDYIFQFVNASVTACTAVGIISDILACQITDVSFEDNSVEGLRFSGTNGVFIAERNLTNQNAGTAFDLQAATFTGFSLSNLFIALDASATFLDGAASSANMATGALGTVLNVKNLSNVGTMLSTITTDDAQWEFELNDDIADTRPDGLLSLQGNAVNTTITVQGTAVLVAGTWDITNGSSQMTLSAAGRMTYDGVKDARLPITASVTVEPASGGAQTIAAYIAVDGVIDAGSKRTGSTSAGNPTSITIPWQETFSNATFVEVFVANDDGTNDVLVSSATFRVN